MISLVLFFRKPGVTEESRPPTMRKMNARRRRSLPVAGKMSAGRKKRREA
jgi:hypothetical protein